MPNRHDAMRTSMRPVAPSRVINSSTAAVAAGRAMIERMRVLARDVDEGRMLVAERRPGAPFVIHDADRWAMIEQATK